MKLLEYDCSIQNIHLNQAALCDSMKAALYAEDQKLFDLLEFDNDRIFLEPSLLCYFLSPVEKEKKITLQQSLFGYISSSNRQSTLKLKSDLFGLTNIPNLGYLKTKPFEERDWHFDEIIEVLVNNRFLNDSSIRLCLHPTDQLAWVENISFNEPTTQTLASNITALNEACRFIQDFIPAFWKLIEIVTREFVVFNSPNHNSFAGISHHGTAYFNTEDKNQTPVFFIDDISHQCGHIIFNALTLDYERYLRVKKDKALSEFIDDKKDPREVYGAFHGLFTYTCILYSLEKLLDSTWNEKYKGEAIGRLGFYMNKF